MQTISKRGFTLVELLIVIGILAVLATTAVVILNPAQLLAQARDSQRLSDLGSLQSALALYMSDVTTPDLNGPNTAQTQCDTTANGGKYYSYVAPTNSSFIDRTTRATYLVTGNIPNRTVDGQNSTAGSSWLPIKFTDITSGSPLSTLPIDPTDSANFVYRYACQQPTTGPAGTYEIDACLESTKYIPYMQTDGGDKNAVATTCGTTQYYEVGTDLITM